jgi:hypothetical protein
LDAGHEQLPLNGRERRTRISKHPGRHEYRPNGESLENSRQDVEMICIGVRQNNTIEASDPT